MDKNAFRTELDRVAFTQAGREALTDALMKGEAPKRRRPHYRWMAAAACLTLTLAGLNLSPTLAHAAANVPVLGGLFQVLTFVDYQKEEDGIRYDVSVPKVEAWGGREMDVIVDYEIKSQTENRVSFTVSFAEGWVSSYEERYYYNLDLSENRDLTLRDLLGEDWASLCNAAIQKQIDESVDQEGFTPFFKPEEGGFTTVDENTSFYVREDGVVVVCFPRYDIAAGFIGIPEFPIQ